MKYIRKIFSVSYSLLNGMAVSLRWWVTFPKFTVQYPKERHWVPDIERGPMVLLRDAEGAELCNGCGICATVCTASCISLERDKNKEGKMIAKKYDVDFAKCTYCNLCVEYCPRGALRNTPTYEWGFYNCKDMLYRKGTMTRDIGDKGYIYPSVIDIPKK